MKGFRIDHVAPFRTGGELYRVVLSDLDDTGALIRTYEVWATNEAIADTLRITTPVTQKDAVDFAEKIYLMRKTELIGKIPQNEGAFVTNESGIRYDDYYTFPGSMTDPDPFVQTNISLPTSLHKWLKIMAAEDRKSISEIIRLALDDYRKSH
jgi:hypothetical protein